MNVRALARAAWTSWRAGRFVSGGSTLTMQAVRLLEPRPRTIAAKIDEIGKALRLERRFDKTGILTLYLTLAPFGRRLDSVRAASLAYLGKEPKHLTQGEAATFVAIPQAPEGRRPDRSPPRLRTERPGLRAQGRPGGSGAAVVVRRRGASEL